MYCSRFFFSVSAVLIFFALSCASTSVNPVVPHGGLDSIRETDLHNHMAFLASDELMGRETGGVTMNVAARYLANEVHKMGLEPAGDAQSFLQHYTLKKLQLQKSSRLAIRRGEGDAREFRFVDSFLAMPSSQQAGQEIAGEVVFAGYGISAPEFNYDDYKNLDVKDKIVLAMNAEPRDATGKSKFDSSKGTRYGQFRAKLFAASKAGAKALILVTPPGPESEKARKRYDQFAKFLTRPRYELPSTGNERRKPRIPLLTLFGLSQIADAVLEKSGRSLADLKAKIDAEMQPASFPVVGVTAAIQLDISEEEISVPNVVAMLEGSDPVLKKEVVLYSAHFDHVGTDGNGGVFNGADDDASGTTALLEIAQAYAQKPEKPLRSIVFLWVSGEEKGLLGSRFYSENPAIAMEQTIADINMDMIGRVRAPEDTVEADKGLALQHTIYVVGGHQSSELKKVNEDVAKEIGLKIDYTLNDLNHPLRIYYRSDHFNFARKGVPVLFYTTGLHKDYHKITDTIEKINFTKIRDVARMAFLTGWRIANQRERIKVDNLLKLN